MNKTELKQVFKQAKENKNDIYVSFHVKDHKTSTYIISKYAELDDVLEYYFSNYNYNGVSNNNPDIRIIDAGPIDFYMGE